MKKPEQMTILDEPERPEATPDEFWSHFFVVGMIIGLTLIAVGRCWKIYAMYGH